MSEASNDLVFHDGFYFKEEQLLKMAMTAGSWSAAEHYMFSLLAHAVLFHKIYIIDNINEVREYYRIVPIPKESAGSGNNKPHDKWQPSLDDQARMKYASMNGTKRKGILRECMQRLRVERPDLFLQKIHWMGVYLVFRDRLEDNLSQTDFFSFAQEITPDDWPEELKISKTTFNNFGKYVKFEDRYQAYYDMKDNPWKELCDTFWNITKPRLLTEIIRKK